MGKLRDKMKKDMELKNLSERTIATYLNCMRNFVIYYGKSPEHIGHDAIRDYIYLHVARKKLIELVSPIDLMEEPEKPKKPRK